MTSVDIRHRARESRDARFDGQFFVAVHSTGVYCRPSCPATPKRENITFLRTAAAAQARGYRACLRCRPDAAPGSPDWDVRADLAGRVMRLIADGVADREGVPGLARRIAYSERHLHRQLVAELGAGPLALARAHRAQTARCLIDTTNLSFQAVARAAGFSSVRQFNDTIRVVFGRTPTELRGLGRRTTGDSGQAIVLRLPYRQPFAARALFAFLAARAVPGIEEGGQDFYRRTLRLPSGPGIIELCPGDGHLRLGLELSDIRDVTSAVERSRRLLDLDADPAAINETLGSDPLMGPLVSESPGIRVPGHVDGAELAVRAVLGQQISVPAAKTLTARLVERLGDPLGNPRGSLTHVFPRPEALSKQGLRALETTSARRRTLSALANALASGDLTLEPGFRRDEAERTLLALPGIGAWTAGYIGIRALKDPDAFPRGDARVRRALEQLGRNPGPAEVRSLAERWRPWRSYAVQHLWRELGRPATDAQRHVAD